MAPALALRTRRRGRGLRRSGCGCVWPVGGCTVGVGIMSPALASSLAPWTPSSRCDRGGRVEHPRPVRLTGGMVRTVGFRVERGGRIARGGASTRRSGGRASRYPRPSIAAHATPARRSRPQERWASTLGRPDHHALADAGCIVIAASWPAGAQAAKVTLAGRCSHAEGHLGGGQLHGVRTSGAASSRAAAISVS